MRYTSRSTILYRFLLALLVMSTVLACKKKYKEEPAAVNTLSNGILVLNEGLFQQNNSSLSWINLSNGQVNNEVFLQKTNRELGDTGNDLRRYGGKIYIVVSVSSTIEVLDAKTLAPIQQISMLNGSIGKQPRSIEFYGSKAYVSCYDGYIDVIDTAGLYVEKRIAVGANPERLTIAGSRLFVTNSGGLNFPDVDSTVSVIDLASHTEITKIVVGKNPGDILTAADGKVYAISRGDYSTTPSRMHRIHPTNLTLEYSYPFDVSSMSARGSDLLLIKSSAGATEVDLFSTNTQAIISANFIDLSGVNTLYGIHCDLTKQRMYCLDAMGYTNSGYVREYNFSGTFLNSFHVGLNPSKLLIYD